MILFIGTVHNNDTNLTLPCDQFLRYYNVWSCILKLHLAQDVTFYLTGFYLIFIAHKTFHFSHDEKVFSLKNLYLAISSTC